MNDYSLIDVYKPKGWNKVKVLKNPTPYELIGRGMQGAVFKISDKKCVKLYPDDEHRVWEEEVLKKIQSSSYFPKIYESDKNYLVMEYVDGITLEDYLKKKKIMPESITKEIIAIHKEMERLKFTDRDIYLRHFIVINNEKIKVIDHVKSFTRVRPQPKRLIKGLKKLGLLDSFLLSVKKIDYKMYRKWRKTVSKYR
ncbi:AarF/UbiB family protein [Halalkalibacter alkaliphilus]|uniref:AarF/UbiB family protein n=1 Tax=Halalkalibacter alkaliphilus TaxID=2917993 RepID=A0A9X2CUT9_9BACI|nr:AarF/UbiB family protein [Halalkalibacter alkaliphilus]